MPFLEAGDVRLHYQRSGQASEPCLVLSSSLGTDLSMWDEQLVPFEQGFDVVRYDMRGHGQSSVTSGPYSIEQCGRDVLTLLDALEIRTANFCGLSIGGVIGQWLACNAPDRIVRLVLANTAAKIGTPETWNARIDTVMEHGISAIADGVLARWFTPEFLASERPVVERMRSMLEGMNPTGYVAMCAAIRDMDQRELVNRITQSTLVIAGAEDSVTTTRDADELCAAIPQAKLAVLPAAHISNVEAAASFTEAVLAFLHEGAA